MIEGVRWRELEPGPACLPAPAEPGGLSRFADAGPAGQAAIERGARVLAAGGLLVHPTSTVYGLGGRPEPEIDERISAIKRRPTGPLIRLAAGIEEARAALPRARWTDAARRLAAELWPGPLTLVLDDGSEAGVALRVDGHPVVLALLRRAGGLMTSTSLNETGRPAARTCAEVHAVLERLDLGVGPAGWLDAGDLPPSPASTLVSARTTPPAVLREGAIPPSRIERILR